MIIGIGGNIAAIQSSRISTWLHQTVPKGKLPKSHSKICIVPGANFIGKGIVELLINELLIELKLNHAS